MDEITIIRKALRKLAPGVSVRRGRGTATCWIEVWGSGEYRYFTPAQLAGLNRIGLPHGGNCAVISPDDQPHWARKLAACA